MKWHNIPVHHWSTEDVREWLESIGLGGLSNAVEHNAGMDLRPIYAININKIDERALFSPY